MAFEDIQSERYEDRAQRQSSSKRGCNTIAKRLSPVARVWILLLSKYYYNCGRAKRQYLYSGTANPPSLGSKQVHQKTSQEGAKNAR